MNSNDNRSGLDRRALARRLALLAATASVQPALLAEAESKAEEDFDALAAHATTALAASPAVLSAQQRLEVRNAVRDLQKTLAQARSKDLPNEADPAFIFHAVVTP